MPGPRSAISIRTSPSLTLRRDGDRSSGGVVTPPARVFQGVVDEVRDRLAEQFAAAVHRQVVLARGPERHAGLLGQRLVKLGHVAHGLGGVEIGQALARACRLRAARSSEAR